MNIARALAFGHFFSRAIRCAVWIHEAYDPAKGDRASEFVRDSRFLMPGFQVVVSLRWCRRSARE
jgi:hypothetical protein